MKKRNRIYLIIVILLGTLAFWFVINNKKGTGSSGKKATLIGFPDYGSAKIPQLPATNRTRSLKSESKKNVVSKVVQAILSGICEKRVKQKPKK